MPIDSLSDYRDIVVASGLERLGTLDGRYRAAVIYGASHVQGIKEYLENPGLRDEKRKRLYEGFDEIARPELSAYRFGPDGDGASTWTKIATMPNEGPITR